MLIIIRADASESIGSGHIMRCLTLAKRLKVQDAEVWFVCRDLRGNLAEYILSQGFGVHLLPRDEGCDQESKKPEQVWKETTWTSDAEQTIDFLKKYGRTIDWLIVDHYGIDHHWQSLLRGVVNNVMVIDDLANRRHHCDVLLDQNLFENPSDRYAQLVPRECRLLLGPSYALLRPQFTEFCDMLPKRDGRVRRVLLFYGGSDPNNDTMHALKALEGLPLHVDVVIGSINPHKRMLAEFTFKKANVNLHCDVDNMAELMIKADLSIGASGSVSWERCCVGLPAIIISIAKNQEEIARNLSRYKCATYLGKHTEVSVQEIRQAVQLLISNPQKVIELGHNARRMVDGYGTIRVCRELV